MNPMALVDLWRTSRDQIAAKHVQQLVAFAGDGRLSDGSQASAELRTYLAQVPSELLIKIRQNILPPHLLEVAWFCRMP